MDRGKYILTWYYEGTKFELNWEPFIRELKKNIKESLEETLKKGLKQSLKESLKETFEKALMRA